MTTGDVLVVGGGAGGISAALALPWERPVGPESGTPAAASAPKETR